MTITVVNGASAPVTTYSDGPGNPTQGSLVYAIGASCWWYFQINSANDATGTPGTHKVSAWYNTSPDCAAAAWTYYGDSPNLDNVTGTALNQSLVKFRNGRSLGAYYWNNASGTNKDICHIVCGLYMANGVANDANSVVGNLRVLLGNGTLTWGTFGYYLADKFNYADATTYAAFAMGRDTNGHMHVGGNILTDQLDTAVMVSQDADTSDTWLTGGRATGNNASGSAVITNLSNETGLAASYGCMNDQLAPGLNAGSGCSTNMVKTVDSGTQLTLFVVNSAGGFTGGTVCWTNFTAGSSFSRHQTGSGGDIIADSSMTKECNAYGFVTLAAGAMLMIYDPGSLVAPTLSNLSSIRGNGTYAAGVWSNAGGPDATVFSGAVTINDNDWCCCGVSTSAIYCARWASATTCEVRNYVTATNLWQAITNAPPTMTGKSIKVGGGVCLVSDGNDMWLLVIDATDAQVKYVKHTHGSSNTNGTWGAWTNLAAVGSTATFLTAVIANGHLVAAWSEINANATNYDTKAATLNVGYNVRVPPGQLVSLPAVGGWT